MLPQPNGKGGNIFVNVCMVIASAAGTVFSDIAGKMGIILPGGKVGRSFFMCIGKKELDSPPWLWFTLYS